MPPFTRNLTDKPNCHISHSHKKPPTPKTNNCCNTKIIMLGLPSSKKNHNCWLAWHIETMPRKKKQCRCTGKKCKSYLYASWGDIWLGFESFCELCRGSRNESRFLEISHRFFDWWWFKLIKFLSYDLLTGGVVHHAKIQSLFDNPSVLIRLPFLHKSCTISSRI